MNTEPACEAIKRVGRKSRWSGWLTLNDRAGWPRLEPSFKIGRGAKVYTVGSCFARNIEEHLDLLGCDVPTLRFEAPKSQADDLRTNSILNKYTPGTIHSDFAWADGILRSERPYCDADADSFCFDQGDGTVIDLQLGGSPVALDEFYNRRRRIYDLICNAFDADLLVITLGLTEGWRKGDVDLVSPPMTRAMRKEIDKFEFIQYDYASVYELISDSIGIVRSRNPDIKVLITTSPVPLGRTFSGVDVLVANMTSKSTLRSVAMAVARNLRHVDYFPSFEIVWSLPEEQAFEEDRRHVRDEVVGAIVSNLVGSYFPDQDDVSTLLQHCAALIKDDSGELAATVAMLRKSLDGLEQLSDRQAATYLRACWRIRDRDEARRVGLYLMTRPERTHAVLRAVAHVFPRIGLVSEAKDFAAEVARKDPSNKLAQRIFG